jgi:hypothetical protein
VVLGYVTHLHSHCKHRSRRQSGINSSQDGEHEQTYHTDAFQCPIPQRAMEDWFLCVLGDTARAPISPAPGSTRG